MRATNIGNTCDTPIPTSAMFTMSDFLALAL